MRNTHIIFYIGLSTICLTANVTTAAVCQVPSASYPTITAALKDPECDVIEVADGIYSREKGERFPLGLDRPITLQNAPGARPHLEGDGEHTVVLIETSGVTVRGFEITNGSGSEGINKMDGGGICIFVGPDESGDVHIVNCLIEDNVCPYDETYDGSGGGIYCGGTYCQCFQIHITNCTIRGNEIFGQGGGVCCALLSNILIRDSVIEDNVAADHGGGVFVDVFAWAEMTNVNVVSNDCTGDTRPGRGGRGGKGGGLACDLFGVFTATDCLFEENYAWYLGGGIFTWGSDLGAEDVCGRGERFCYVFRSEIRYNKADDAGGGVYVAGTGTLRFLSSTLYRNDAVNDGGGVFVAGGTEAGGQVHFLDCNDCELLLPDCSGCDNDKSKLEGNECGRHGGGVYIARRGHGTFASTRLLGNSSLKDGGALYLEDEAKAELADCLLTYNNSARGYAGGIRANELSDLDLDHCSVVGNFAPHERSGLYLHPNSTVSIIDSILWRNAGGSIEANGAPVVIASSWNEDDDPNATPGYAGWGTNKEIYVDESSTCPGAGTSSRPYCDLQYALDRFSFRLSTSSPCVGTASDGGNMGADTGLASSAGNILVDMHLAEGAYDIRGRNIICIRNIYGVGTAETSIENAVFGHIESNNIMDLSITAEHIFGGFVVRADVNFDNCLIHHNHANADGGGIYVAEAHCTLEDSTVSTNGGHGGGGLYADVNTVTTVVGDSHISYNSASAGGGIHMSGQLDVIGTDVVPVNFEQNGAVSGGGVYVNKTADANMIYARFCRNNYGWSGSTGGAVTCLGDALIRRSVFQENEAEEGAAIRIDKPGMLRCEDCEFKANKARWRGDGGALYMTKDTAPVFIRCEFIENWARFSGGVGYCLESSAVFEHCIFTHNTAEFYHGGCFCLSSTKSQFYDCQFTGRGDLNRPDAQVTGGVALLYNNDMSRFESCLMVESVAGTTGGALHIQDTAKPHFLDVRIVRTEAIERGGGVFIRNTAEPNFFEVTISDCTSVYGGGVYATEKSNSRFRESVLRFNDAYDVNESADGGGAFFTEYAKGTFAECDFLNNRAEDDGGGLAVFGTASVDLCSVLFACNVAVEGGGGIHFTADATGRLTNCTVADNESVHTGTGGIYLETTNIVTVNSSIVWGNSPDGIRPQAKPGVSYSCCQRLWTTGPGNMVKDPLFANPADCPADCNDYRLMSQAGRCAPCECACNDPGAWVRDAVTSPCIDSGDPSLSFDRECSPNGAGINMGRYGNTPAASKSARSPADFDESNRVYFEDLEILCEDWLAASPETGADMDSDGIVDLFDYSRFALDWMYETDQWLVAHWKLDEGQGDTAHDSVHENHAELCAWPNGPVWTDGKIGGALLFDGVDDYLDCNNADELGPEKMNLSMWLKPDTDLETYIVARGKAGSLGTDYALKTTSTRELQFSIKGDSLVHVTSRAFTVDEWKDWIHVAVLLDGSGASIHIGCNDVPDDRANYGGRIPPKGYRLVIGFLGVHGFGNFYAGKVDDVRIYERAVRPSLYDCD